MGIHQPPVIKFSQCANLGHQKHQAGWEGETKRLLDKLVAGSALITLSPLLLGVAVGIKLSGKGPVIFKQPRHGKNNTVFHVWKFRTMNVMETGTEVKQAVKNDPRITRFGKFLRKTSIDELPQLVNVLKGEMSLVGPRPHPVALNAQFGPIVPDYWSRHVVTPGITGLAQIRGYRGITDTTDKMRKRVESDIEYITNWSLLSDLKILCRTPWLILTGKNAD